MRTQIDREHLARASREAKIIKLLDRIDNLREMDGAPGGFVRKYCRESRLLSEAIGDADPDLHAELLECIDRLEERYSTQQPAEEAS